MYEGIMFACQVRQRGLHQDLHFEGPNAVQKEVEFVRHDGAREFATNSLKFLYEDEGIE